MANNIAIDEDFWVNNRIFTPNQIKRMLDAEFISELFIAMLQGIQQKDADHIDAFYLAYDQIFPNKNEFRRSFLNVLNKLEDIFQNEIGSTRLHGLPDFYSLFIAIYQLNLVYYFPEEKHEVIKKTLIDFITDVDYYTKDREKKSKNKLIQSYVENVISQTTHKSRRENRYNIFRELLIPFLTPRDNRRAFSEEERRIAWNRSQDKKCVLCGKTVSWEDYHLDHITPWNKGEKRIYQIVKLHTIPVIPRNRIIKVQQPYKRLLGIQPLVYN